MKGKRKIRNKLMSFLMVMGNASAKREFFCEGALSRSAYADTTSAEVTQVKL